MNYNSVAIIGAGISGLSFARMLPPELEVIVYERNSKPGGLVSCDRIVDVLFHKVGGHVFNSKNQDVLDWFWKNFDRDLEFVQAKRSAKILYNSALIGYPIENYLYALPETIREKIISELQDRASKENRDPFSFDSFEAFLLDNFGRTLYDVYFKPYNEKIWGRPLSSIPMHWLEGKLPMPNIQEILNAYENKVEETNMVHATFYYPKYNGSQFIADRLSENLHIQYHSNVNVIECVGNQIKIMDRLFDAVVYTGDIRSLVRSNASLLEDFNYSPSEIEKSLQSNGTFNVLCYCDATTLSWLYIPEKDKKAHRIIFTGNFSPTNQPLVEGRSTCVVEFSKSIEPDEIEGELSKLPFHLEPILHNHSPASYVVHTHSTKKMVMELKKYLENKNIYLLGRFAEWEYYNMDKAMEAAMYLVKQWK